MESASPSSGRLIDGESGKRPSRLDFDSAAQPTSEFIN
jgi:hypothetical protein